MSKSNVIALGMKVVPAAGDSWAALGACRTSDLGPDAWFPEPGIGHADRDETTKAALRTCRACPVSRECLLSALARNERYGIWGGMTERQRNKFVKQVRERRAARKDPAA
jgi:WhiB family redox-sensing transcriptional regulator